MFNVSYQQSSISVHDIQNYTLCEKQPVHKAHLDFALVTRLNRLKKRFEEKGCIRSVEGVLITHQNKQPMVLILQSTLARQGTEYRLPGGKCKDLEDDRECLFRKMQKYLCQEGVELNGTSGIEIRELIAEWVRPNFESLLYPYLPPHVSKPKEVRRVYMVQLPPSYTFSIPKNMKLLAVPLIELYDNNRYGCALLAALPQCMSRYSLNYR
eukprot:PhF_6_TR41641/c0_g2_i1/m.63113/K14397/NUDT21, CPSF5, CFIM25; cleavage and polyadenylation specificity factor subunit 5